MMSLESNYKTAKLALEIVLWLCIAGLHILLRIF